MGAGGGQITQTPLNKRNQRSALGASKEHLGMGRKRRETQKVPFPVAVPDGIGW
jgi:hypothetical protein